MSSSFRKELARLLNAHSKENGSDTPDWILAEYLENCLLNFDRTVMARAKWYGRMDVPGEGSVPFKQEEDFGDIRVRTGWIPLSIDEVSDVGFGQIKIEDEWVPVVKWSEDEPIPHEPLPEKASPMPGIRRGLPRLGDDKP